MAPENDLPPQDDVRKKALLRLAVAGVVTTAALAGLWWLDQDKAKPEAKPTSLESLPKPIRSADAPEAPAPELAPGPASGENLAALPLDQPADTPSPDNAPTQAALPPPPPPRVDNRAINAAQPRPATPPSSPAAAQSPQAPQPAPAASVGPKGNGPFLLQLGVFHQYAHAEELVQRLRQQGIQARTETRVHLGPFLNRQEAEKAQAEMRRLGVNAVVTASQATK